MDFVDFHLVFWEDAYTVKLFFLRAMRTVLSRSLVRVCNVNRAMRESTGVFGNRQEEYWGLIVAKTVQEVGKVATQLLDKVQERKLQLEDEMCQELDDCLHVGGGLGL